jgi:hypothetical protein
MVNYIEGTFFKANDGSPMLHIDDKNMISPHRWKSGESILRW